MTPQNAITAHNIKLLRLNEGLTQKEFGKKYDSNQKNVWAYEKGTNKPKGQVLLNISKGTGIPPEILLTVKLKKDRVTGAIINLPSKEKQVQQMRTELKTLIAEFEKAQKTFFKGLIKMTERLDIIEKQLKK